MIYFSTFHQQITFYFKYVLILSYSLSCSRSRKMASSRQHCTRSWRRLTSSMPRTCRRAGPSCWAARCRWPRLPCSRSSSAFQLRWASTDATTCLRAAGTPPCTRPCRLPGPAPPLPAPPRRPSTSSRPTRAMLWPPIPRPKHRRETTVSDSFGKNCFKARL